jgi:hypothetical protein
MSAALLYVASEPPADFREKIRSQLEVALG